MDILIQKYRRATCPGCKKSFAFQRAYAAMETPLKITCPKCNWFDIILDETDQRYNRLPKPDMSVAADGDWIVEVSAAIVEDAAKELPSQPAETIELSFAKRSDQAAVSLITGLQIIQSLKADLEKVSDQFREEIETVHAQSNSFRQGWNPALLTDFMLHPFMRLPAYPLDTDIAERTCFLMTPKFYNFLHGLPLSAKGGFYIQLITPYSQLHFLLESWMRTSLDYPEPLALEFQYSKIIGHALHAYWSKIDGVVVDEDHSLDNPSVLVANKRQARQWMVKQGLPACPFIKTNRVDLFPAVNDWIKRGESVAFREAFNRFLVTGRMALGWKDVSLARSFALYLGTAFKRHKLVIKGSAGDTMQTRLSQTGDFAQDRGEQWRDHLPKTSGRQDFLWHNWREFATLEGFDEFDVVIVDVAGGVPLQFLDMLHNYSGRLILILSDPLMDTLEENEIAPAIYSLCNSVHYYAGKEFWEDRWKELESPLSEAMNRAVESLFK